MARSVLSTKSPSGGHRPSKAVGLDVLCRAHAADRAYPFAQPGSLASHRCAPPHLGDQGGPPPLTSAPEAVAAPGLRPGNSPMRLAGRA